MLPNESTIEDTANNAIPVNNAGLVLLQGYFYLLFERLGLIRQHSFVDERARFRGITVLQYIATGMRQTQEERVPLNNMLCGLPPETAVPVQPDLTEEESEMADSLLRAAIGHWPASATSLDGFRSNWLLRQGLVRPGDGRWDLAVEQRPYDVLLTRSPFVFSTTKLPWMSQTLYTDWIY